MELTVVIVDDDPTVLFLHDVLVKRSGLSTKPISFSNGKDTLDYLIREKDSQKLHLLLLDINMENMSGWELLDKIGEQLSSDNVYTIMVTSSVDRADHERVKNYPHVIGFLEKPMNVDHIHAILRTKGYQAMLEESAMRFKV
jgi:response regulator RpfG family c-di-GMP phosphodiesterase